MAANPYVQLLQTCGLRTVVRGLFLGAKPHTGKDDDGKEKVTNHFHIQCGNAMVKVGYKPTEYKHDIPAEGCLVEMYVERGEFKGKPFYNAPGKMRILADEQCQVVGVKAA